MDIILLCFGLYVVRFNTRKFDLYFFSFTVGILLCICLQMLRLLNNLKNTFYKKLRQHTVNSAISRLISHIVSDIFIYTPSITFILHFCENGS